jgi:hypothetical protein
MTENGKGETPGLPEISEIEALIEYVAERGIEGTREILNDIYQALHGYLDASEDKKAAAGVPLLENYAALCAVTYPANGVNGRTILDTKGIYRHIWFIMVIGLLFATFAFGTEMLDLYFNSIPHPDDGFNADLYMVHGTILTFLSPFFWGGLGASVYLFKRVYDASQDKSFDKTRIKGASLRIWLGAILGAAVQYIYDDENITSVAVNLDANVVAFLTGVSVKVVYGAIEKSVQSLSDALNLKSLKKTTGAGSSSGSAEGKDSGSSG